MLCYVGQRERTLTEKRMCTECCVKVPAYLMNFATAHVSRCDDEKCAVQSYTVKWLVFEWKVVSIRMRKPLQLRFMFYNYWI